MLTRRVKRIAIIQSIESCLARRPSVLFASQGNREFWIMTAVATQSAPQYVQQSFLFDDVESPYSAPYATSLSTGTLSSGPATRPSGATGAAANSSRVAPKMRNGRPAVTVPTVSTSTSARRGRCEHVGGILASVLEKYGIGIDQLIAEIDGAK